jgi:hypothetical protein
MADGASLAQQQAIAAEIPYKNIAINEGALKNAMNAFYIGTEINRRKQQLENQLTIAAMKAQQQQGMMAIREQQFGLALQKADWQRDKDLQTMEMARDRMGLGQQALDIRQAIFDRETQKRSDEGAAVEKLYQNEAEMAQSGIIPGTENYETQLFNSMPPNLPASLRNNYLKTRLTENVNRVNNVTKENTIAMDSFAKRVGREVFGTPTIQDFTILKDPDSLPSKWTQEGTWPFKTTKIDPKIKLVPSYDPGGNVTTKDVPLSTLKSFQKEYEDLLEQKKHIPVLHDHPDLGVSAKPRNLRAEALDYLSSHKLSPTEANIQYYIDNASKSQ